MSYTSVMSIYPSEKVEVVQRLDNAWGSAPVVWLAMNDKYFPGTSWINNIEEGSKFWSLWKRPDIPFHQRAVFFMTFDRAYISKKNYQRAADDIKTFFSDFPPAAGIVNHWLTIISLFESNPDFPGIGFYVTSVSENPWDGEWDDAKEEYAPLDWDNVYEVYEILDGVNQAEGKE